jgi:hypothetical protein
MTVIIIEDLMKIPADNKKTCKTKDIHALLAAKAKFRQITIWIAAAAILASIITSPLKAQTEEPDVQNTAISASESDRNLPQSRLEMLKLKREQKAKNLVEPKQGIVEKYAKSFDRKGSNSIEDVNFWGFHPRIDWIARGSGIALGARYWKPQVWGPIDVMGAAFYSRKRYQHYDLQLGLIPNRGKRIPSRKFETEELEQLGDVDRGKFSRFKLYVSGRFRDRTDESYYGSGPDSVRDARARYRVKDTLLEAVTGYQITDNIGFTYKAGLLSNSLLPGRSAPPLEPELTGEIIPGKLNPPNYFRSHVSFLFDFRDDPGLPHKGFMFSFGWEKYDNVNTKNLFNFNRFGLDARVYVPLGNRQRVFALRAVAVNSDPAPDNQVPFFLQPSLGGGESLRGYDAFRFQGDKMLLLQGEYRWEASRRFELAFFGDTATVADQGTRLSVDKMKSDAGIGIRFKSSRATLFRLDVARSNEGIVFQFRTSAVF